MLSMNKKSQNLWPYDQFLKDLKGNLKLGVILVNFATFRDLITKEDLEETYRTLYFFESPLHVGYGKNNEKTPNQA